MQPPVPVPRTHQAAPYSNLPAFPPDIEAVSCSPAAGKGGVAARLGNPYDTMPADYPSNGVYSDPGEITISSESLRSVQLRAM